MYYGYFRMECKLFFSHEINCGPFLCENGEHFYEKSPAFSMYGCVGVCVCVGVCTYLCMSVSL